MITQASRTAEHPLVPELSLEQQAIVDAIVDWRERWPATNQTLTLGGLAGTGKSQLVAYLARHLPKVVVACPTGKAANVLRGRGTEAQTVHSLIYWPKGGRSGQPQFRLVKRLDADTIIIDEASMVTLKMYADLCKFGKPILFVGDHGQLEAIGDSADLMKAPDLVLEQIQRQDADNPIIKLGAAFREGRESQVWTAMQNGYWQDKAGRCTLINWARLDEYLFSGMQVIVGFNKVRHAFNSRIRRYLGHKGLPAPGEKLICLQNNARFNLFNGQECVVVGLCGERHGIIELELKTDDGRLITAPCLTRQLGVDTIKEHRDASVLLMDFGYVLTVHKAQGSAWEDVLVVESIATWWDARRWRYTAVTRAINRIVYCR